MNRHWSYQVWPRHAVSASLWTLDRTPTIGPAGWGGPKELAGGGGGGGVGRAPPDGGRGAPTAPISGFASGEFKIRRYQSLQLQIGSFQSFRIVLGLFSY